MLNLSFIYFKLISPFFIFMGKLSFFKINFVKLFEGKSNLKSFNFFLFLNLNEKLFLEEKDILTF